MEEKKLPSGWEYRNTVLIRTPKDNEPKFQWHSSVLAFEFDGVLIQSKAQSKVIADFELLHPLDSLKEYTSGVSIVVLSNQKNVGTGKISKALMQARFDKFIEAASALGIPCIGLFSTKTNCFCKPHTGLWRLLTSMYIRKGRDPPDPKSSVYVGNNAGRIATYSTSIWGANPKDISYIDRAFASNIGIKFWTPDAFFNITEYDLKLNPRDFPVKVLKKKEEKTKPVELDPNRVIKKNKSVTTKKKPTRQWEYPADVMKRDELDELVSMHKASASSMKSISDAIKKFESTMIMVLLIGPPGSGKSTIAEYVKNLLSSDYKSCFIVSGLKSTCKKAIKEYLRNEVNFIVDNCNQSAAMRKEYIDLVKNEGYAVLMIDIKISDRLARHLSFYSTEVSSDFSHCDVPNATFAAFNKKYDPASSDEIDGELPIVEWITTLPYTSPQFWMIY